MLAGTRDSFVKQGAHQAPSDTPIAGQDMKEVVPCIDRSVQNLLLMFVRFNLGFTISAWDRLDRNSSLSPAGQFLGQTASRRSISP